MLSRAAILAHEMALSWVMLLIRSLVVFALMTHPFTVRVDAGTEAEYQCRTPESASDSFRPVHEASEVCVKTVNHTAPHARSVFRFCSSLLVASSRRIRTQCGRVLSEAVEQRRYGQDAPEAGWK